MLLYVAILIVANVFCLARVKWFKRADRLISIFLLTTLVVEVTAYIMMRVVKNNMLLYEIFNPVELLLICLYFDSSLRLFRRSHAAAVAGIASLAISLGSTLFLKHGNWINVYFLLYESTVIIALCLLALYEILMDEERLPYHFVNFWITVCLLIYWSFAFTGWGMRPAVSRAEVEWYRVFIKVLQIINYFFYAGLALIFLRYKKLIPSGAR